MILSCDSLRQSPAVSESRKATLSFTLDCCTPGRRGFPTGATVKYLHGKSKLPEYATWKDMRRRCNSPNRPSRKWYHDKGIRVCKRWDDFGKFIKDMGRKPTPKHTIERVNVRKGYSPSNCRWATAQEQHLNRTDTRRITFNGQTKVISQWEEEYGIRDQQLYHRLNRGWDIERALITPVNKKKIISKATADRIRSLARTETYPEISRRFNIHPNWVGIIVRRERKWSKL